jgi:hypothetical protein
MGKLELYRTLESESRQPRPQVESINRELATLFATPGGAKQAVDRN